MLSLINLEVNNQEMKFVSMQLFPTGPPSPFFWGSNLVQDEIFFVDKIKKKFQEFYIFFGDKIIMDIGSD